MRLLLLAGFLDEFAGVGFVTTADIQTELQFSYAQAALALFTLPELAAMGIEPVVLLTADRWGTKPAMVLGLGAMALGLLGCALATGLWSLAFATTVYFIGTGVGVNLAKTTLMDSFPEQRAWLMARWTLLGALGDIGTPVFVAVLAWASLGWRTAFGVVGLAVLVQAIVLVRSRSPLPEPEEDEPGLWDVLRELAGERVMFVWLFASAMCGLLDEVFVAFGGLYLLHAFQADTVARSSVLACFMVGGVLGVLALERALAGGVRARRLLVVASGMAAVCFVAWLLASTLSMSALTIAGVGFFAAQLWPLTETEAYEAWPGSATQVEVASYVFAPLQLGVPLLIGVVGDTWGIGWALGVLLLQPILVLAVALQAPERARAA